jgi:hypothetical protein
MATESGGTRSDDDESTASTGSTASRSPSNSKSKQKAHKKSSSSSNNKKFKKKKRVSMSPSSSPIDLNDMSSDPKVLQAQIAALSKKLEKQPNKNFKMQMAINRDLSTRVTKHTKETLWLTVKVIRNDKELEKCAKTVWKKLGLGGADGESGEIPKELLPSFIEAYGPIIKKSINARRNYFQEEQKKAWYTWWNNADLGNGSLPTAEEVLQVFMRTSKNDKLALFIWDKVLVRAVGIEHWGPPVRNYNMIHSAMQKEYPDKPIITAHSEAYCVLMVEMNGTKWQNMWQYEKAHPSEKNSINWRKLPEKEKYVSKYSIQNSGQSSSGGWSTEGIKRYAELFKMISDQRASLSVAGLKAYEEPILSKLREVKNISVDSHEDLKKRKRKRSLEEEAAKKKAEKVNLDLGLSDDDDDDDDAGSDGD